MNRMFDPNTNPYADDLLRLGLAPRTRFSMAERRAIGHLFAAKLYGLEGDWIELNGYFRLIHYAHRGGAEVISIVVLFDNDEQWMEWWLPPYLRSEDERVIALSVGAAGVVELYNGRWTPAVGEVILDALDRIRHGGEGFDSPQADGLPPRSDEEVRRDYLGRDRDGGGDFRGGGGTGGGDGGDGGGPTGGEGGVPGTGGARELLNHPVLFSVDRNTFDAILEQT